MTDAEKAIFYQSYPKNSIAHDAPPDPLVVWEERPSPHPSPLSAFGASLPERRLRRLFNIFIRTPPF